ncbi:MAG: GTPase Der [Syntrophorhabdus sp. PtaU1.Bin058]|nr:MAG: GTPase Der [Syntrophorhabdus sp. PtaU1.Bin058]
MKQVISVVGRPNVGKSTFFNRMLGYRKAITEDTPGVTRDRNYGEFEYRGKTFILIDTGGFEPFREDGFSPLIEKQIQRSIQESSIVLFLLDGREGILPEDKDIAKALRRYDKPVFYIVNKVDSQKRELSAFEFYELGIEKFYPISALHGTGIEDLLEDVVKSAAAADEAPVDDTDISPAMKIALIGRPNTGKSSITNRLLRSDRMIVSEVPGTTRDAIDSKMIFRDREIILIDTAGLRKKSKVTKKIEEYSVSSAIKSVERAQVVNLVIDAGEGASHQDGSIAHLVAARGKGICIIINKWDLVEGKTNQDEYGAMVLEKMPHVSFAPILFVSAKTGKNIEKILSTDVAIYGQLTRTIKTQELNRALEEFLQKLHPPHQQGKSPRISYISQPKALPPTFILFSSHPRLIPEHYKRYLENSLRNRYGFHGAPIRLVFRKK